MTGLIFYDNLPQNMSTRAVQNLLLRHAETYSLDYAAYDALYYRSSYSTGYDVNLSEYKNAFDFCYDHMTNSPCTMLAITLGDFEGTYTATDSYYSVYPGACADSFTVSDEAWCV